LTADYDTLERTDANLAPATFPGKTTTGKTSAFSVGCWINLSIDATGTIIAKTGSEVDSFRLWYDTTANHFAFDISANGYSWGGAITGATTTASTGTWYHIVGVYTGTKIRLYVGTAAGASVEDNTEVSYSTAMFLGAGTLVIGGFSGLIDEAFIINKALSGAEVESIRAHGLAGNR
jgi:hypothetical protein